MISDSSYQFIAFEGSAGQRAGNILQLVRQVVNTDIDTDTDNDALNLAAFKISLSFGENAADLFSVNIDIIDPCGEIVVVSSMASVTATAAIVVVAIA